MQAVEGAVVLQGLHFGKVVFQLAVGEERGGPRVVGREIVVGGHGGNHGGEGGGGNGEGVFHDAGQDLETQDVTEVAFECFVLSDG